MPALPTLNAASPLNADDANRLLFTIDATPETLSRALDDTPSDFETMDDLSWTVQERENVSGGNDTVSLNIRIVNGATILAAASSGGSFAQVIQHGGAQQHTNDTNRGPTAFAYVNTTANKATWDGATVELQQVITKNKGPDGIRFEVDIVSFTGNYTAANVALSGSGPASSDGTGDLSVTRGLSGSGAAASDGSGNITGVTVQLAGSGPAASDGSGDLTVITPDGQTGFRIRSGDTVGLNVDSGWEAALNQDASMAILDLPFRIRFLIGNESGSAVNDGYQLRVSINSGAYTLIQNNSDPYTLTAEQNKYTAEAIPSDQYADLAATTQLIGTGTFTAGVGNEDNTSSVINLPDGNETELEWCINLRKLAADLAGTNGAHIADGDTIDFRVYYDDGTALPAYSQTPRVTIANRVGHIGGTEIEAPYRHWFQDKSGNLYYLSEYGDIPAGVADELVILKSTDNGVSWTPVDEANVPAQANDLEAMDVDYIADEDEAFIIHEPGGGNAVRMYSFRTADHATNPDTYNLNEQIDAATSPGSQVASIHKRSDNTIVAFFTDTGEQTYYRIRSTGGTWGARNQLDTEASTQVSGARTVLDPDTDIIHIFYHTWNGTVGEIFYNTLSASDVLGTRAQVDQGTVTINPDGGSRVANIAGAAIWDKAGTKQIGVAYHGDGVDDVVWNETDVATPDWTANEGVALSTVETNAIGGDDVAAHIAVDDDHDEIWVIGSDETTQALEYDRQRSGTWDGDTTYDSDVSVLVRANVIVKTDGDLVLGFIRYDKRGLARTGINPGNGFQRYEEILIARRLVGSGANAADGSGDLTVTAGVISLSGSGPAASDGSGDLSVTAALSGAGDAASDGTGTITVYKHLSGSGPASSDGQANLGVTTQVSGSGAASSDGTGTLDVKKSLSGSGAASSDGQGTLSPIRGLAGSGPASSEGSGDLTATFALAGSGPASSDGQATLTVYKHLAGSGAAASEGSGVLDLTVALAGSGPASSEGSGDLTVTAAKVDLSGSGPAASDGSGALSVTVAIAGSGPASTDGSGDLTVYKHLSGSGAAASDGVGTLDVAGQIALSGSGPAAADGSGVLDLTLALAGAGPTASEGSGDLTVYKHLAGSGPAASAGSGDLAPTRGLSGSGPASSEGQGDLTITAALAGSGPASSDGQGTLSPTRGLAGSGAAASEGSGDLTVAAAIVTLSGSGPASSDGSGVLAVTRGLAGSGASASAGTGSMQLQLVLQGSGAAASAGVGTMILKFTGSDDQGIAGDRGRFGTSTDRGKVGSASDRGLVGSTTDRGQGGYTG